MAGSAPVVSAGEKLAVAIPAYQAAASIGDVVRRARALMRDVLVIDDGSDDGTADGVETGSLAELEARVAALAWRPDGARLAAAAVDGQILAWDVAGQEVLRFRVSGGRLNDVAYTPDGRRLASVTDGGMLRVSDASDGAQLFELRAHESIIRSVAIDPAGARVATGGGDGPVRLWSLEDGSPLGELEGHRGTICDMAFDPAGKELLTGATDRSAILWDLERGLPTTPADILALRRVRSSRRLSTEEYLRALARLPPRPPEAVPSRRRVYGGEPFRLTD